MFVVSTPFAVIKTNVLTDLLQITTLTMEIQQFMTVKFSSKEIFNQLEFVELKQVSLGSIGTFVPEIKRTRSLFVIVSEGVDRAPRGLHHVRDAEHAPVSSTSIHCS